VDGLNLTKGLSDLREYEQAKEYHDQIKAHADRLFVLFPNNGQYRDYKSGTLHFDAMFASLNDDVDGMLKVRAEGVDFARDFLAASPKSKHAKRTLLGAISLFTVARCMEGVDLEAARKDIDEAIAICDEVIESGGEADFGWTRANLLKSKSGLHNQLKEFEEAQNVARQSIEYSKSIENNFGPASFQNTNSVCLMHLADASYALGDLEAAAEIWQQVIDMNAKAIPGYRKERARIFKAMVCLRQDKPLEANELVEGFKLDIDRFSNRIRIDVARFHCLAANLSSDPEFETAAREKAIAWIKSAAEGDFFSVPSRVDYFWNFEEFAYLSDDPQIEKLLVLP